MSDQIPTATERLEKVRWRSRRGLLELELLLKPFVEGGFDNLPESLKQDYERLLDHDDLDAHEWLLARTEPPAELKALIAEIRQFLRLS